MDKIGKYKIVEKVGKGGMGVVFKALDPRIGRVVAIKTLFAGRDVEPEIRHRFLQEARSAGALSHKNIITIYDMDEDAGQAYIVMEYLEGEDLRTIISRKAPMALEQRLHILIEVCEGLAHAHSMGVIHRDIKPGNIFITRTGQIKILDFGLARIASSDQTQTGLSMGTPSYMSPEQVRGDKLDHRTDIFSFGVVAYELLAGAKPFQAETDFATAFKITHADPDPLDKAAPAIPIELASVIAGALEKEPEKRYQQADDALRELEAVRSLLEERKRVLREEVRTAVVRLEELVRANKSMVEDVAEKLEGMKQAAPEFFESTFPTQTGEMTPRRRAHQLDYLALLELRERATREYDRVTALLEKRQRATYLLREVEDLERGDQLESALQILDFILREDPTYATAAARRKDIAARIAEQQRLLQQARRAEELLAEARSRLASSDLARCQSCLSEVLQLVPDHSEALALQNSVAEKIRQLKKTEEQRRRAQASFTKAQRSLADADFQRARAELAQALREWPDLQGAADLQAGIDTAEREAAARAAKEQEVRRLLADARSFENSGRDEDALARLEELIAIEPRYPAALELRSAIEARRTKRQRANDLFLQAARKRSAQDQAGARSLLVQALELDPAHTEARNLLAEVEKSIEEQKLLEKKRRKALEALESARRALAGGRLDQARREVGQAQAAFPDLPDAIALIAEIDQAEERERLKKEREQTLRTLFDQARSRFQAADPHEALSILARVLDLEPGHRQAAELKQEIEASIRAAELAVQQRREKTAAVLRHARSAAGRNDFEKAISLARTVAAEPEAAAEIGNLIPLWEIELERRREIEEQDRLKIAQFLDSARRMMAAKAFLEARKTLQSVLEIRVDNAEALELLKQVQQQIESEKNRQAREEEAQQQKLLGLRLLSERKHRESLPVLRRALQLLGEDAGLRSAIQEAEAGIQEEELRARVQASLVEARRQLSAEAYESAHAAALQALELAPEQADARELLQRIESALQLKRKRTRIAELLAQGRQAMVRNDFQEAARLASEILLLDSQNAEAKTLLSRIEDTQLEKSRRVELAALLAQSSQALAAGDFQQAAVRAREVLLLDPQNADAQKLLRQIDETETARHRHDRISGLMLQARQARSRGDLDEALTHVQEILRLDHAHKDARALQKDLEKGSRAREREQERERKRTSLELRTQVATPGGDATLVLGRQQQARGALAWARSPWVIGIAALILAGIAYVAFRPGSTVAEITVISDPDGVSVFLDERPAGTTSSGRLQLQDLPPGKVALSARKPGFTPFTRELTLVEGKNPDLSFKLAPVGAELRIRTDQAGVHVQVDGIEIGQTSGAGSATSLQIEGGTHTVALIKEGFEEIRKDLTFTAGEAVLIDETLRPLVVRTDTAVLRILTNPSDANVFLDGKRVGISTGGSLILQDLKPGTAKLTIRKQGYREWETSLRLEAGRALDQVVTLPAMGATLMLTSNAPGAEVLIDNVAKGKTDAAGGLTIEGLSSESRTLKIVKEGFQEKMDLLNLKPGETTRMQVTLAAAVTSPALLSISSSPAEASVFIDDQFKGNTPLNSIRLEPGSRKIRLRKEGYREIERTVDLRAGEPKAEPFNMERMQGTLQFSILPEGAVAKIGTRTFDTSRQKQVDLEPGNYSVEITSAGHKTLQRSIVIQDRQTAVLQAALEALAAPAASSYTEAFLSLDNWDHPAAWQADGLLRASGGGFGLLKERSYENFKEIFQLRLNKGVQASWVVRYQDERNYCLIQINSDRHPERAKRNTIYFSVIRDGQPTGVRPIPLPFQFGKNKPEWIDIQVEVAGSQIIARGSIVTGTTTTGGEMGRYSLPPGVPARGKVGFAVFQDEEFEVNGFVIDPTSR